MSNLLSSTNTEHATAELFAALSAAQGEIENANKNAKNPHFKSKYADLAEILNTTRPTFAKHGLSLSQFPAFDGALASVVTVIAHSGGGYIAGVASCVPAKSDAQGIGSATTYLRRYSAAAAAGIAQEDDDGESAKHDRAPASVEAINAPKNNGQPRDGVLQGFSEDDLAELRDAADSILEVAGEPETAWRRFSGLNYTTDWQAALGEFLTPAAKRAIHKGKSQATKEAA